jgi:hypothetical protein
MLTTEVVMTPIEKLVRPARIEDADVLADLVDYAGEGLPSYLWDKIAGPGETAREGASALHERPEASRTGTPR